MPIEAKDIKPGRVYRGKRQRYNRAAAAFVWDDRTVISMGDVSKAGVKAFVEFEPVSLRPGRKYPVCTLEEFLMWADFEIEKGRGEKS